MTRTGWYPPGIKPVRVGDYETCRRPPEYPETPDQIFLDYWNGEAFVSHDGLIMHEWTFGAHWRGLTAECTHDCTCQTNGEGCRP